MYAKFRPTHCGFETLRRMARTSGQSANRRIQIVTNEQLTARGYADSGRPSKLYSDFIER
jgi:hypothetical protein